MAVYERKYKAFDGALTPAWSRFLVLPRYAYETVLSSKLFVGFLVLCLLPTLIYSIIIYLPHNLGFLKQFNIQPNFLNEVFGYGPGFFLTYMRWQQGLSFGLVFILGPALISADLRNNGLPLYLARPFNRTEYIVGKMSILLVLLSLVTWVPGLWLFALQSYVGGSEWLKENYFLAGSIFLASWIWILVICLVSLAVSAYVKWKPVARLMLLIIFLVLGAFATIASTVLRSDFAEVLNLANMVYVIWQSLFQVAQTVAIPFWLAWASIAAYCGLFLLLLNRKLRAYEVVR